MNEDVSDLSKSNIFLNHVLLTVDNPTFTSFVNSKFLKDKFAFIESDTNEYGGNKSYSRGIIKRQNTYIELFSSGSEENNRFSGLSFGIETVGGIDSIYNSIPDSISGNFVKNVMKKNTEKGKIPWFFFLTSSEQYTKALLRTWVMEYDYNYMKRNFPDIDSNTINISRKLYNSKKYRKDLLLKDIIEIDLALNEFDANKLLEELKLYGYKIVRNEKMSMGYGQDIKINIMQKTESQSGLCRIKFSLAGEQYIPQTFHFGDNSRLIFNSDRKADWNFYL